MHAPWGHPITGVRSSAATVRRACWWCCCRVPGDSDAPRSMPRDNCRRCALDSTARLWRTAARQRCSTCTPSQHPPVDVVATFPWWLASMLPGRSLQQWCGRTRRNGASFQIWRLQLSITSKLVHGCFQTAFAQLAEYLCGAIVAMLTGGVHAAAHRASCRGGPVGGSVFVFDNFLIKFILLEHRSDLERSNALPLPGSTRTRRH